MIVRGDTTGRAVSRHEGYLCATGCISRLRTTPGPPTFGALVSQAAVSRTGSNKLWRSLLQSTQSMRNATRSSAPTPSRPRPFRCGGRREASCTSRAARHVCERRSCPIGIGSSSGQCRKQKRLASSPMTRMRGAELPVTVPRWAWFVLAAAGLALAAWMTRYEHIRPSNWSRAWMAGPHGHDPGFPTMICALIRTSAWNFTLSCDAECLGPEPHREMEPHAWRHR
jgi:hypothetical protein